MATPNQASVPRWANALFIALYLAYAVAIAVAFWRNLHGFAVGDEHVLAEWLEAWHSQGTLTSMSQGLPMGFLAPVGGLATLVGELEAGRLLSTGSILLLGASVWWLSKQLGAGRLGRRLAMLAFLNMVVAGNTFVFNAIGDSFFTLVMFWVIVGIAVGVVERRMGVAILAGAGWAFAWTVRPLAPVYTLAIVSGLGVLILLDAARGRALRYALAVCLTAGCGVLLVQAPALRASGELVFEKKTLEPGLNRQRLFLSILRHDERQGGGLRGWLWIPKASVPETVQYLAEHGADSLPRTRTVAWRRAPFNKAYQFVLSISVRTTYYLAALMGFLLPLAWLARPRPGAVETHAVSLAFAGTVVAVYLVLINGIASPFIEWRWFLLPAVALMCAGSIALERLLETRPAAGLALLALQLLFMCASCAVWGYRVAIGYPPRGSF